VLLPPRGFCGIISSFLPQNHMANNHSEVEKRLWEAADELRANSNLKSSEYSVPVLTVD
jgi:predicted RNA-binding protein with EMAP domain